MVSKEREMELFCSWYDELNESWRDNAEDFEEWRKDLTGEEKQLVAVWDREPPVDVIGRYRGTVT